MVDKKNTLIAEAKTLIPKSGTMSRDADVKFNKLTEQTDAVSAQVDAEVRKLDSEYRNRPPRGVPGGSRTNQNSAEKRAFSDYMRYSIVSENMRREQRDLSTTAGPVGGYLIAQDFNPVLVEARKDWGQLAYEVGQKVTKNGEPLRISGVDDTSNMSTTIGESVTGNPVAVSEVDPTFAGLINNVDFMTTGEIRISMAELQDSLFDLDAWTRDAFGKRIARGLANRIVNPGGFSKFQSIISTAPLSYTTQAGDTGAPQSATSLRCTRNSTRLTFRARAG